MKNKRPLAPGFINKLDKWMLLNKPDTWSARTHLVLYYGLLFALVLTIVCFAVPNDPRQMTSMYVWTFFVAVLAAIGFIVWLIFLLRFNVFKRFGIVTAGDKIKSFLLYFVAIGTITAVIYIPSIVESIRANNTFGNDEIVQDVNTMNLAICRLNYDSIPHKWHTDTLLVRDKVEATAYDDEGEVLYTGHKRNYHLIDTANFANRKAYTDSIIAINDSVFVEYKCPDYNFVNAGRGEEYADTPTLRSREIYAIIFKQQPPADQNKLQAAFTRLLLKYDEDTSASEMSEVRAAYDDDESDYSERNKAYFQHISVKYKLYTVNNSLNNIANRKYQWRGSNLAAGIRVFYYCTLIFTLLVFIFRHSSIKTFFLTLLTAVVLLILTALFLSVARAELSSVIICCFIYFLVFAVLACMTGFTKTRNVVTGIALNLVVFFTVFVPMLVVLFYYQLLRDADNLIDYRLRDMKKYEHEELHYLYAQIIGAVLLLVLIETLFKKWYRKWYALPEA